MTDQTQTNLPMRDPEIPGFLTPCDSNEERIEVLFRNMAGA